VVLVVVVPVPVAVPALRHRRVRVDEPRLRLQRAPDVGSYFTTTAAVSDSTDAVSSSTPSTASVRAQSIVSEIDGDLRSSSSRIPRTISTNCTASASGSPVFFDRTISSSRPRRRVFEEQVQAAPFERGGEVAGVVAGQDDVGGRRATNVPPSGTDTWYRASAPPGRSARGCGNGWNSLIENGWRSSSTCMAALPRGDGSNGGRSSRTLGPLWRRTPKDRRGGEG
jgi:hypothetical protein